MTERFPELAAAAAMLPDGTVLDGEIMPWREGGPLPFAQLQRRIGRKVLGPKILAEVPVVLLAYDLLETAGRDARGSPVRAPTARAGVPAVLPAYDLLESEGRDVREEPLRWRRARLEELIASLPSGATDRIPLSPIVPASEWDAVLEAYRGARERASEG